jgi:hypothetical protein
MITAAGTEPGLGGVGPRTVIRTGCANRGGGGGGGQSKHRMGLGDGGPDIRSGLAVSLAEQPVRLSGKFLSPATGWAARRGPAVWAGLFRAAWSAGPRRDRAAAQAATETA